MIKYCRVASSFGWMYTFIPSVYIHCIHMYMLYETLCHYNYYENWSDVNHWGVNLHHEAWVTRCLVYYHVIHVHTLCSSNILCSLPSKFIVIIILHHTEPLLNDNQLSLGSLCLASLLLHVHVFILVKLVYDFNEDFCRLSSSCLPV